MRERLGSGPRIVRALFAAILVLGMPIAIALPTDLNGKVYASGAVVLIAAAAAILAAALVRRRKAPSHTGRARPGAGTGAADARGGGLFSPPDLPRLRHQNGRAHEQHRGQEVLGMPELPALQAHVFRRVQRAGVKPRVDYRVIRVPETSTRTRRSGRRLALVRTRSAAIPFMTR